MTTTRLYLVDDQELFRTGLKMVLGSQPDFEVVGEAGDADSAIAEIPTLPVDVVLMDIRMPGLGGIEATTKLLAKCAQMEIRRPRILMLTTMDTDDATKSALAAGADGYMLKDTEPEFLISAVRALAAGAHVVVTSHAAPAAPVAQIPAQFGQLTDRERDVFMQVMHGLSNREIAETLFVSEATIKTHLAAVLRKLDLRDRVQAVIYGYEHGINRLD